LHQNIKLPQLKQRDSLAYIRSSPTCAGYLKERNVKKNDQELPPLHPNQIVRLSEGEKYLGYRHSQRDELIKAGKLPAPISLVDGGKAKAWTGQQIIDHQRERLAAAAKKDSA
jgi:predicted DNA-binding transcriptional regulator AlpA